MREFEIFPALYFRDTLGIEQEKFIISDIFLKYIPSI